MTKLKDVAKLAGVSTATVSRVLNGTDVVNEETKRRVHDAIKELDYQPSRVAQRLRNQLGSSKLIGLLLPDIQNPFYTEVIQGVESTAYSNNYSVIICNFSQDEKKEREYLDILKSENIDGLIVAPVNDHDHKVTELVKSGMPIVCVDRSLSTVDVDQVVVDNFNGALEAVSYLLNSGHTKIAHIGGIFNISTTQQRYNGYIQAFVKKGLKADDSLVRFGDSKYESGCKIAGEMLDGKNPPTALFTGNNLITLGALEAIHERGLRIPEDISIIGFDDMYWAKSLNPPLSSVRQPGQEIGKRATELLFQRIEDQSRPKVRLTLKTELIIRKSTK